MKNFFVFNVVFFIAGVVFTIIVWLVFPGNTENTIADYSRYEWKTFSDGTAIKVDHRTGDAWELQTDKNGQSYYKKIVWTEIKEGEPKDGKYKLVRIPVKSCRIYINGKFSKQEIEYTYWPQDEPGTKDTRN